MKLSSCGFPDSARQIFQRPCWGRLDFSYISDMAGANLNLMAGTDFPTFAHRNLGTQTESPEDRGGNIIQAEQDCVIPTEPEHIDQDTAEVARIYRQLRETDELITSLQCHLNDPKAKQRWLKARQLRRELHLEALKMLLDAHY